MSNDEIVELAAQVRRRDSDIDDGASVDDVVETLPKRRVAKLSEEREKAEQKQSELRAKMGVASGDDGGTSDDVSAKQAELREQMGR